MYEEWCDIEGFPGYQVSNYGNVLKVEGRRQGPMSPSKTNYGDLKVALVSEGRRVTRSLRTLVAEAFVAQPPYPNCNTVIVLDGDRENVAWDNLAWRPRWFAWKYTRQQQTEQPDSHRKYPVVNERTHEWYPSIIECGNKEGLLYEDIARSLLIHNQVFPTGDRFKTP